MGIDVNKPLENPKLKELFSLRNAGLPEKEYSDVLNQLLEEIVMNAHFLSVIQMSKAPEQNGDGTATFKENTTIGFPMLSAADGRKFYPVFIDWEELGKWEEMRNPPPQTLILSFDDYASMVLGQNQADGIVVNPFSDNLPLDRDLMMHLRARKEIITSGCAEIQIEKDTPVRLGEPAKSPVKLIDALVKHAQKHKNIRTAWLRLMEKEGELSFLVVVDADGDRNEVFASIAEAARPYLDEMYLDMVPFHSDFGRTAVDGVTPIYQKKKGFFKA